MNVLAFWRGLCRLLVCSCGTVGARFSRLGDYILISVRGALLAFLCTVHHGPAWNVLSSTTSPLSTNSCGEMTQSVSWYVILDQETTFEKLTFLTDVYFLEPF